MVKTPTKIRINWSISHKTYQLLQETIKLANRANPHKNHTISELIDQIVQEKLQNPLDRLREEARAKQKELQSLVDRINEMEELQATAVLKQKPTKK
jgi:hypothetical protein